MSGGVNNTGPALSNEGLPSPATQQPTVQKGKLTNGTSWSTSTKAQNIPVAVKTLQDNKTEVSSQKPLPRITIGSQRIQTTTNKGSTVWKKGIKPQDSKAQSTPAQPPSVQTSQWKKGIKPTESQVASSNQQKIGTHPPIQQNTTPASSNTAASPLKNYNDKFTCGLEVYLSKEQHEVLGATFAEKKLSPDEWNKKLLTEKPITFTQKEWDKLDDKQKVVTRANILLTRTKFVNNPTPPSGLRITQDEWRNMPTEEKTKLYYESIPTAHKAPWTGGVEVKLTKEEADALDTLYKNNNMKLMELFKKPPNVVNQEGLDKAGTTIAVARYLVGLNRFVNSPKRPEGAVTITEKQWKSASTAKREQAYNHWVNNQTLMRAQQSQNKQLIQSLGH